MDGLIETEEDNSHYVHSVLRERIVEHVFVGEALRRLWQRGVKEVEVLRSEFDAGGYDLVMNHRKVIRHIQFKSVMEDGKAANVKFGGPPGEPLPDIRDFKAAKHSKANAEGTKLERPTHRIVPLSQFEQLDGLDAVLTRLFGAAL